MPVTRSRSSAGNTPRAKSASPAMPTSASTTPVPKFRTTRTSLRTATLINEEGEDSTIYEENMATPIAKRTPISRKSESGKKQLKRTRLDLEDSNLDNNEQISTTTQKYSKEENGSPNRSNEVFSKEPAEVPVPVPDDSEKPEPEVVEISISAETETKPADPASVDANEANNDRLAAREKLQASNDHMVRKLYRTLSANCREVENVAMNFICDEIHHPAISCFREVMNLPDVAAIFRTNSKKTLRSLEFGLIGVGMLDSIATTLYNPLYQETYDCLWNRKVSEKVLKILQKLTPLITTWGSSEKASEQERYASVLKYLQRLTPHFGVINFCESYELALSKISEDVTQTLTSRQELRLKTHSFFNSKETVPVPSSKPINPEEIISNPTTPSTSRADPADQDAENDGKISSYFGESPSPQKKSKVLIPLTSNNAPEADDVVIVNLLNRLIDDKNETQEPESKKPRVESDDEITIIEKTEKPKVNAFALMMNRSRQLAEMSKLKQTKNSPVSLSKNKLKAMATLS